MSSAATPTEPRPDAGRTRALVFSAGAALRVPDLPEGFHDAIVVAADAGAGGAIALGLHVDVLVGDFDSIDAAVLDTIAATTVVERHPPDKDATDLELAIDAAVVRGATEVCVLDAAVGRLDHVFATMLLLASPRWHAIEVQALIDGTRVIVVPPGGRRTVGVAPGRTVSLLSIGGAHGVSTAGLQYPLCDEVLPPGTTRGVSNVVVGPDAWVAVSDGTALVVVPAPEEIQ